MTQNVFTKEQALYIYEIAESSPDLYQNLNISDAFCEDQKRLAKQFINPVKEYLRSCLAYQDIHTRIIIEENAIYFGHSLLELEVSFPKLASLVLGRPNKRLTEENILEYSTHLFALRYFVVMRPLHKPILEQQNDLLVKATEYFSSKSFKKAGVTEEGITKVITQDFVQSIFKHQNTFIIGEKAEQLESKKLLIDNMAFLKESGLCTIYLEHVLHDTQKELLEAYFSSKSLSLPIMLRDYLQYLDERFNLTKPQIFTHYGYLSLVVQAKRYGIRITPIDTMGAFSVDAFEEKKRSMIMNYLVALRYESLLPSQKAVFLVEAMHTNLWGIKEMTGANTLVVKEHSHLTPIIQAFDNTQADFLIYLDSALSKETLQLAQLYEMAVEEAALEQAVIVDKAQTQLINHWQLKNRFFTHHLKPPKDLATQALGLIVGATVAEIYYGRSAVIGFISAQVLSIFILYLLDSLQMQNQVKIKLT